MVILKFPAIQQSYEIRGLTPQQAGMIQITARGDKMKMVIGLLVQGVVNPRMTIQEADRFCVDHATEAAQIATEIIRLTTGKPNV